MPERVVPGSVYDIEVFPMNASRKPVLVVVCVVLAGFAILEARRVAELLNQNQVLQAQLIAAREKVERFQHEQDGMNRRLASQADEMSALAAEHGELQKVNEEVERLRKVAGSNDVATAAVTNESERLAQEGINVMKRAYFNWTIDGKLLTLKHHLDLTPEQETAIRSVLERLLDPEKRVESYVDAKKHYDADLAAFLSPEQLAVASQMEKDEKLNEEQHTARDVAQSETENLERNLDLTPDQRTAVAAAILEIQTKAIALQSDSGNLTPEASAMLRNEKFLAVKELLTDEQLAIYKKYYDEETRSGDLLEAADKID